MVDKIKGLIQDGMKGQNVKDIEAIEIIGGAARVRVI